MLPGLSEWINTFNQVVNGWIDVVSASTCSAIAAVNEGFERPYRAAGSPYGPDGCARWWRELADTRWVQPLTAPPLLAVDVATKQA
jgi:hypothetical protein